MARLHGGEATRRVENRRIRSISWMVEFSMAVCSIFNDPFLRLVGSSANEINLLPSTGTKFRVDSLSVRPLGQGHVASF